MKIAVLMWYDDKFKSYGDNCYKINKVYCDKYGYDLIKTSKKSYNTRSGHWERYPLILKHIEKYDYVVWIDADAFFYNVSPPITNLINKYKKEIIFSEDDNKLNPPAINTGVAIFKNTKRVINVLKKWAYSNELKDKYCGFVITDGYLCPKTNWIEDQALVRGYYQDNVDNIRSISEILPYRILQHYHIYERDILFKLKTLPYIFHFAGRHEERYKESKKYLDLLRKRGHKILNS
jgi:hypothetical protein|tara:strand:- start:219 stop:923 length:705 start_codon:yes stop_codon:yes gene_type:complete